jgi:hypothetical protein
VSKDQFVVLPREQLYNEVWKISGTGVSKKYNVPYAELLRRCKEADIPLPPSGYWTKLNFGKQVTQIPLPESQITEVALSTDITSKRSSHATTSDDRKPIVDTMQTETSDILQGDAEQIKESEIQTSDLIKDMPQQEESTYRTLSDEYNIYSREKLYEEVWTESVVQVAKRYGVSDVAIHKVCKSLNIPVPPPGYWARVRAGQKLKKTPLPPSNGISEKIGARTYEGKKVSNELPQVLSFLTEDERHKIFTAAQHIQIGPEDTPLHKKINAYKSAVREWNKKDTRTEGAKKSLKNYYNRPPFLAGVISDETLPRVYRILDTLFRAVEKLGGSVNDGLSLQIRNEHVELEIFENQDEVNHILTRQEAQEKIIYEDAKRHDRWASKPNIRKYDYAFNGRLRICIRKNRYFRDSDKVNIESRLGEMLIELYEESEVVRIDREAREEAKRKEAEEKRLREEHRERYNEEVDKTIALTNEAQDYDLACKIRAYITALEPKLDMNDKNTVEYVDWVRKKADWFDPTVAREDELFGERAHEENEERKALKKKYYSPW